LKWCLLSICLKSWVKNWWIFIKFKNEILRTYVLRMTSKGWLMGIRGIKS
jgi:hypothetical protein